MRGKRAKKHTLVPDAKFNSLTVAKLINYLMLDGKKSIATNIVYDAMEGLDSKVKENKEGVKIKLTSLEALDSAIDNVKPRLEIRSRRVGGANYQIPVPVSPDRQTALAMKWIIGAARDGRKKSNLAESLKNELSLALNNQGIAIKKKEDTQKMADANKAFAQFA